MIVRSLTILIMVVSTNALNSSSNYAKIYDNVRKNSELYDEYTSFAAGDHVTIRHMSADRMLKLMNTSVDPCEDFYQYACGNFGDYVKNVSVSNILSVKQMFTTFELEELIKDMKASENIPRSIVDLYDLCMGHDPTKVLNANVILSLVDTFLYWHSFEWTDARETLSELNIPIFYSLDATAYFIYNPVPFKRTTSKVDEVKQFFNMDEEFLTTMLEQVENFEEQLLAEDDEEDASESDGNKDEPNAFYTVAELAETFPSLKLAEKHDPEDHQKIKIKNDKQMKRLEKVMNTATWETLYYYTCWQTLLTLTSFQKSLVELSKSNSTSLMCTQLIAKHLPNHATSFYTTQKFQPEVHADVMNMLTGIRTEIGNIFGESRLMKAKVKAEALQKLANIKNIVWAPDSVLNISTEMRETRINDMLRESTGGEMPDDLFILILALASRRKENINEDERISNTWKLANPFECNAFYLPRTGVIAVLLGILGHPFYNINFPQFYKYGSLGFVVGHELMHGFDSDGYKYDADFKKRQWIPPRLDRKVIRDMECYYTLYKKKFKTDGALTMGENLADNVGLEAAFKAYKTWTESVENVDEIEIEGFEKLGLDKFQMFFLSNAQTLCTTDPKTIEDDPHSTWPVRVLATLSNSKEFSEAFQCPVGSPMNPRRKCQYLI